MKKFGIALKGIATGFAVGFGVYIVLGIILSLIFKDNPVIYMNLPSVAVGICPFIFCIRALKKDAKKARERSYKTSSYYGAVGSTIKPQQSAQTRAPHPSTAYAAPQTTKTTTTRATPPAAHRPVQTAAQQRPQQSTTKAVPKASPKPTANTPNGLIAKDFISALSGALKGLLAGVVLFFVFGLIASLTMAHPITNVFTFLGGTSLLVCIIVAYVTSLKEQPKIRKEKARRKAAAQEFEQNILNAFDTLNTANTSTEEGAERYAKACDFLIYAFSAFHNLPEFKAVATKHRHKCFDRTYYYYAWNSRTGKYEYVPGTELMEEILKETDRLMKERDELFRKG